MDGPLLGRQLVRNLTHILSILAALFCLTTLIMLIAGLRPYILRSESMEPTITKGSLCLVNTRLKPEDIEIGDVVVYRTETGILVMHRYIAEGKTKGDANQDAEDIELTTVNLVGREVFAIPHLGDVVGVLTGTIGRRATLALAVILVVIACLPRRKSCYTQDSE